MLSGIAAERVPTLSRICNSTPERVPTLSGICNSAPDHGFIIRLIIQLLFIILNCLILCGCITEYEAAGIDEISDILVVEGIITDDESTIILSRSVNLSEGFSGFYYINDAAVYVECEDGTLFQADIPIWQLGSHNGRYTIKTGPLDPEQRYRLKIEIEEMDYGSGECSFDAWDMIRCPTITYEYCSDFSYPIKTPEIDSIFWTKRSRGQPVLIQVATHSPDNSVLYCRWSYREDWEIRSEYWLDAYPYYCWGMSNSREILLGSAEKTVSGRLTDILTEIFPSDRKLSVLYRIDVTQNAISKRAYDYLANVKKNAELTGSIFAPVPSELRGNITCTTDPDKPVIGYVDISTTTQKRRYVSGREVYERPSSYCRLHTLEELQEMFEEIDWRYWVLYNDKYIYVTCVDCTWYGITQKPDDWPNSY